jgi:FKBP-type peptidyl-prolyl cis-trans isomerase SlpA
MAPKAKVYYQGRLEDGKVIDSNLDDDSPYLFELGKDLVFPGFERAVQSMAKGEEREFVFSPDEAYGWPKESAVQRSRRSLIKNGEILVEGARVTMSSPYTLKPMPGVVTKVFSDFVEVDFNHPLAGKTLHYRIMLVDIV